VRLNVKETGFIRQKNNIHILILEFDYFDKKKRKINGKEYSVLQMWQYTLHCIIPGATLKKSTQTGKFLGEGKKQIGEE
jgi:hypothetical protein